MIASAALLDHFLKASMCLNICLKHLASLLKEHQGWDFFHKLNQRYFPACSLQHVDTEDTEQQLSKKTEV